MLDINELPIRLNKALNNLILDLCESKNNYLSNSLLKKKLPYLFGWFDSRIEVLKNWDKPFVKATNNNEYFNSDEYSHFLTQTQTIGQGFDVDLTWSNEARRVEISALLVSSIAQSILYYLSKSSQFEKELKDSLWLEKTWERYKRNPQLVEEFD